MNVIYNESMSHHIDRWKTGLTNDLCIRKKFGFTWACKSWKNCDFFSKSWNSATLDESMQKLIFIWNTSASNGALLVPMGTLAVCQRSSGGRPKLKQILSTKNSTSWHKSLPFWFCYHLKYQWWSSYFSINFDVGISHSFTLSFKVMYMRLLTKDFSKSCRTGVCKIKKSYVGIEVVL